MLVDIEGPKPLKEHEREHGRRHKREPEKQRA